MAHPSTLYRFRIDLTDLDRNVYTHLDFRIALHPSESHAFLITRVLAFALNTQDDLQFSKEGLGTPDEPCISLLDPGGGYRLWIEVGNPSAKKTHKATKSSTEVKIYTYKNPAPFIQELHAAKIYQPDRIQLFYFSEDFLNALSEKLVKDNSWNLIHQDAMLTIQAGDESIFGEVKQVSF